MKAGQNTPFIILMKNLKELDKNAFLRNPEKEQLPNTGF